MILPDRRESETMLARIGQHSRQKHHLAKIEASVFLVKSLIKELEKLIENRYNFLFGEKHS